MKYYVNKPALFLVCASCGAYLQLAPCSWCQGEKLIWATPGTAHTIAQKYEKTFKGKGKASGVEELAETNDLLFGGV